MSAADLLRKMAAWTGATLVAMALLAGPCHAGRTTAAVAAASVQVVEQPLIIESGTELLFGFVRNTGNGGTVEVPPVGSRSTNGRAQVDPQSDYHPAQFAVRGAAGARYAIALPGSLHFGLNGTTPLPNQDGLVVNGFRAYSMAAGRETQHGVLDENGRDIILVGARLIVPAHAQSGTYYGEVPISITYE